MYQFKVPPSWPLSLDFIPYEGWTPHPTFPFPPSNWDFWVLEDYDPTLPVAAHENRGEFNNHPLEIAARRAEMSFIESKKVLNSEIHTALLSRRKKKTFSRFFPYSHTTYTQTSQEKHVDALIMELVHLGSNVRKTRKIADREYELWKRESLVPTEMAYQSRYAVSIPLPSSVNGEEGSPSLENKADKASAEIFWNFFIQKIDQLSIFNLSKTKKQLILALGEAKKESLIYENIIKGDKWIEQEGRYGTVDEAIEAKAKRAEEQIDALFTKTDEKIIAMLRKTEEMVTAKRLAAETEAEDKLNKTDQIVSSKLMEAEKTVDKMLRKAEQEIASKYAAHREANKEPQEEMVKVEVTLPIDIECESSAREIQNLKQKTIDRKDRSSYERSQYVEREVEGKDERQEKARFRREAKVQNEKQEQQRIAELKVHEARMQSEADRIIALEYEKIHLKTALDKAAQIRKHNDDANADAMITALKTQLKEVQEAIDNNNLTMANTRAGWIYVISNVGSLGEGIVKIGVTRKHDPNDRIKELNNASVPFTFDVHVFHFSSDAVGLEGALHRHFAMKKVNLINGKKEFFYATPEEVKEAMQKFSNGVLTHFNVEAPASEWRHSEKIRQRRTR